MSIDAINGFGKQARGTGLTGTSRPGKKIGMLKAAALKGIFERGYYLFLTNQFIKCL